jgi:hypothetical protein
MNRNLNSLKEEPELKPEEPDELEVINNDEDKNTISTESSRPTRERKEPDRLTFSQTPGRRVTSKDDEWQKLEQCHNILAQVHPKPELDWSYTRESAMVLLA